MNFRFVAVIRLSLYLALGVGMVSCSQLVSDHPIAPSSSLQTTDYSPATEWATLQLQLTKTTAGFGPTIAARAYGYAGVTMYESIVPGSTHYRSLAGQLTDLTPLPKPAPNTTYNWVLSLNAGQAYILKNLYATTSASNQARVDSLEGALAAAYKGTSSPEEVTRSVAFGRAVAAAIWAWSKTDGGHEAYKRVYPADYAVPTCEGCWQPTENGQKIPMTPYWGKNRFMVAANATLTPPQPLAYSSDTHSAYYQQYNDVYQKNVTLSDAEKEIAVWWADNPGQTFTPPGHSYQIALIAARTANASLEKAVEGFCRVGIAVNDAFISCWKCKFMFNNERPYTYVRREIKPDWKPFWAAPPFPGYMSGHATQSMAAAEVLSAVYGSNFSFTDDSHVMRAPEFGSVPFKARYYASFDGMAQESALSRFLGGIHTRQDNEAGLQEGRKIGVNVNALAFN